MDSDQEIVPLCLYRNSDTLNSYIGMPTKVRIKGSTVLRCEGKPEIELVAQFYVINPDFRPVPPGMVLLCAADTAEGDFSTVSVTKIYDPFNIDKNCVRFLAWTEPVPHTTPLHIMSSGNSTYISFSPVYPGAEYKELYFSPIYVLADPRLENIIREPAFAKSPKYFEVKDGVPQFRFSGYQGRCIPDPNGTSLGECIVLYTKNILSPSGQNFQPTLLKYLENTYGHKKFSLTWLWAILFFSILIFSVLFVVYKKLK